jgi:RNA polymerase sigma factor for flagellar operon FliA
VTPAEREERILSLESLVRILAKARASSLPFHVGLDDLISAAWVGAIAAVDSFDEKRGPDLSTYASWRIRGSIGDYLRSVDPLSRDHRRRVKKGEEENPLIVSIDQQIITHNRSGDILPSSHEQIPDPREEREHSRQEARLELRAIYRRAGLRPRHAKVLRLYMEGETMKVIGHTEGVKESRISQICTRAVLKLRQAA